MAEKSDLETLAERYLELWQDQVSAMAADPEIAAGFQAMMPPGGAGAAGASPLAAWQAMMAACGVPAPAAREPKAHEPSAKQDRASAPPGAPASAPASERGGGGLGELAQRLAALEDRIAALETKPGKRAGEAKRARPKKPAGGRKSRGFL